MNNTLFAAGLFVFGFTLLFLMPASTQKSWKELGHKPPAGDSIILMMRFMGLLVIVFGVIALTGIVDLSSLIPRGSDERIGE